MKINMPTRFFAGNPSDPNYSENYKKALLMARGDVICQYSKIESPNETDWEEFSEITDTSIYKWIRMSFDGGTTWPLQSKLNSNIILEFSFIINLTNIVDDLDHPDFGKKYVYELSAQSDFDAIKNNPISVYVENTTSSFSVIAPVVYREENNKYYLDILFNEEFVNFQVNKTCVVKVLNTFSVGTFAVPVPVYSNLVNAIPAEWNEELAQNVSYLNNTNTTISLANNLDNCTKLSLKVKCLQEISEDIKIKLSFMNGKTDVTSLVSQTIVPISNTEKWIDIYFLTPVNGNLKISREFDANNTELTSGNNITAYITNIRIESRA